VSPPYATPPARISWERNVTTVTILGAESGSGLSENSSWPRPGRDNRNTRSLSVTHSREGLWSFPLCAALPAACIVGPESLGVGPGGEVHVLDSIGNLTTVWPGNVTRLPGAAPHVEMLSLRRRVAESPATAAAGGIAIDAAGNVYSVLGGASSVQSHTARGGLRWVSAEFTSGTKASAPLALAPGDAFVIASASTSSAIMYAFNASSGQLVSTYSVGYLGTVSFAGPVVAHNGHVITGSARRG
jgi:hypothetical protein